MATSISPDRPLELTSSGHVQAAPKPQLDALTGIRFIAAVLVVLAHVEMLWHIFAQLKDVPALAAWSARGDAQLIGVSVSGDDASDAFTHILMRGIVLGAYIAVDIFFMLSGFVLTYTCTQEDGRIRMNRGGFWATRFARIYPVFLVGLLFYFPLFLITTTALRQPPMPAAERWAMMAATIGLVHAWWPEAANAWNPPAWSLSAEAFFYLVFPFLLLRVDRLRRGQLWALLAVSYLAALLPPAVYVALRPDPGYDMSWLGEGTWLRVIKYNPLIRFPEFLAGVVLGKLFAHRAMQNHRLGRTSSGWLSLLALGGALAVMCTTYYLPYPIMHNGILMPFVGLLIYDLSMGGGPVGWFFSRRPLVLLGNTTYCIYILHATVIGIAMLIALFFLGGQQILEHEAAKEKLRLQGAPAAQIAAIKPPDLSQVSPDAFVSPTAFLIGVSVVCLVASLLMHKLYEEPCRRYLRRKLSRRAHVAIPPPVKAADLP